MNNRMKELKEIIVKLIIILKNFIYIPTFTIIIYYYHYCYINHL